MENEIVAYSLNGLAEIQRFSTDLKKFIKDNKLTTSIQSKDYVNVEGWQAAGGLMGVFPFVTDTVNLSTENEYKYEAKVELRRLATNDVIGYGSAICSNKENRKRNFDEYAIMSMAQTRAIGKAYRNQFAWVMKMSGFEATPAEEMDFASEQEKKQELSDAIAKLANVNTFEEMTTYKDILNPYIKNDPTFTEAKKKAEIRIGIAMLTSANAVTDLSEQKKVLPQHVRLSEEYGTAARKRFEQLSKAA